LEAKQKQLTQDIKTAERRLAVERDDVRYEAVARQYGLLKQELRETEAAIGSKRQNSAPHRSIDDDVKVALELLDAITGLTAKAEARNALPDLVQRLGVRIGLTFAPGIKGTKRQVRVLVGGILAFGDQELPVPLFGRQRVDGLPVRPDSGQPEPDTTDRSFFAQQGGVVAVSGEEKPEMAPPGLFESQQEGISYTKKMSRSDRRWAFPNGHGSLRLFWMAIAQTVNFTADAFNGVRS
jgi:hypothetical protein